MAHYYSTYQKLDFYFALGVSALLLLCAGLLVAINFAIYIVRKGKLHRWSTDWRPVCSGLITNVPMLLFKDIFEKCVDEEEKELSVEGRKRETLAIHGRTVTFFVMCCFFFATVTIAICTFVTFWGVFLIQETPDCDSSLDCFPFDAMTKQPLQDDPITDCSTFQADSNVTVFCYQFALRYAEGITAVGGILAFASYITKICATLIFWTFDHPSSTSRLRRCIDRLLKLLILVIIVLLPVAACSVVGVVLLVPFLSEIFFKTFSTSLQFFAYWLTFTYTSVLTLVAVVALTVYERRKVDKLKRWALRQHDTESAPGLGPTNEVGPFIAGKGRGLENGRGSDEVDVLAGRSTLPWTERHPNEATPLVSFIESSQLTLTEQLT